MRREMRPLFRMCIQRLVWFYRNANYLLSFPTTKCSSSNVQNWILWTIRSISNIHRKKKNKRRNKIPFDPFLIIQAFSRKKNSNANLALCHCEIRFVGYRYHRVCRHPRQRQLSWNSPMVRLAWMHTHTHARARTRKARAHVVHVAVFVDQSTLATSGNDESGGSYRAAGIGSGDPRFSRLLRVH